PTAGLVRAFDDPILGPPAAELILAGRVPEARPARDPAVEPYVDRAGYPPHLAIALLARQDDAIDPGPVEVHAGRVAVRLSQGVGRPNDRPMRALRAPPDRERGAPVSLPRDAPISEVARPVELPRRAGPVREPSDAPDLLDHLRFEVRHLEEPLDGRPKQDRRLAAPTVTVRMDDRLLGEQRLGGAEVRDDLRIRFSHALARIRPRVLGEVASGVHRGEGRQAQLLAEFEVLGSVAGSGVHEPRVLGDDRFRRHDLVDPFPFDAFLVREFRPEWMEVREPDQVAPLLRLDDGIFRHPAAGHDVRHG